MIVVSDTSPLNYLVLINAVDVLPKLFDQIHVPSQVMQELLRSRTPPSVKQWALTPPSWLHVSTPATILSFAIKLDPGEVQAISLAKELRARNSDR